MNRSAPYQPLILRILHGISGVLVIGAIISGFLVYNTFDKRFGYIPIPKINPIQDIHGTLAVFFLILLPFFALYSFHAGKRRLLQPDSIQNLTQFGKPIWWISLQRLVNTKILIAAVLAVISGRMMKEEWLPIGELDHIWYYLHLIAWVIMICFLAVHVLMSAKVGGVPLLISIISWEFRAEDSPANWYTRLRGWLNNFSHNIQGEINQFMGGSLLLKIIEVIVLGGIIAAFVLPLFFSGSE
ncbi:MULTISPECIES: cytochrome b/b6 domain-containing protein [unclassified Anabaena]|uniref:cytochrome b/b6 domain-containing protein n=1 Tax=unclassified Anabaena TaxID=2619674 RepID=UPI001446D887|nr:MULTISPECIES: cytochrome b/b6 domain-containing protein [unclassified Anabaena]MTJ06234.1 cytochrome b/b6 domain-containing protein [Anabaena sp. UHCC 0204]MTJ54676.1 cytochrome b/b6 domain-containing protein [Anabaena sp. UHCC 0253]